MRQHEPDSILAGPPTLDEVSLTIRRLSNSKAVDRSGILLELLKACGKPVRHYWIARYFSAERVPAGLVTVIGVVQSVCVRCDGALAGVRSHMPSGWNNKTTECRILKRH